ncbi:hypothetical protein [Streptomyces sp. MP131-18]|uniref:hypothetical protein n=1 Tax=Streptomyces sp. MP131-18 TaxID=1857892 RepID=UPI00097CBB98|nr:hypothetical protein [Streptomyces sp. MP131-18]ONK13139.1 hypothetical protein STBA_39010 [Streptomyces sp. MP131-18]
MPDQVQDGPCAPWPVDPSCCPGWPDDPGEWTEDHLAAVQEATDVLWRLTGGRYGLCEEVERPCGIRCAASSPGRTSPGLGAGHWGETPCGCGQTRCGCTPRCAIYLHGPVHSVLAVRHAGTELPTTAYAVLPRAVGALLARTDGACWPHHQDLTLPDTAPGTLSVTYLRGLEVPIGGRRAVGRLACEIDKACTPGATGCALPRGVRTVQREGVTYDIVPDGDWAETLRTHMPHIYSWVQLVNPTPGQQRPAVYSLDLPPAPLSRRYPPGAKR